MALQTIKGYLEIPSLLKKGNISTWGYQSFAMTATAHKVAAIFLIPPAAHGKNISIIGFRTGAVTTSDSLKVGIYTVDTATGDATATAYKGMVAGTVSGLAANTWYNVPLGTNATNIVAGDYVAVVIEFNSYVAGSLNIVALDSVTNQQALAYVDHYQTAWTKYARIPVMSIGFSDSTYEMINGLAPLSGINTTAFSSASNPNHRGLRFRLPFPCRLIGIWAVIDCDGQVDIKFSSDGSAGTTLATLYPAVRGANNRALVYISFSTAQSIAANIWYRVVLAPPTATSIYYEYFDVPAAANMDALEGGQDFHYTTANNPTVEGDWTNTGTSRPCIGLLLDQIDDGASAGGGGISKARLLNTGF